MTTNTLNPTEHRERLTPLTQSIHYWGVFQPERGLYFNGYALITDDGIVVIDPPSATDEIITALEQLGPVTLIIITNRDHERESARLSLRLQVPVACPLLDAPLLTTAPAHTFDDGDTLLGELTAYHLPHQKSPGESALYWVGRETLILGDALIGSQGNPLRMLPDEKYTNPEVARASLKEALGRFSHPVKHVLLGDGDPLLENGLLALQQFITDDKSDTRSMSTSV